MMGLRLRTTGLDVLSLPTTKTRGKVPDLAEGDCCGGNFDLRLWSIPYFRL